MPTLAKGTNVFHAGLPLGPNSSDVNEEEIPIDPALLEDPDTNGIEWPDSDSGAPNDERHLLEASTSADDTPPLINDGTTLRATPQACHLPLPPSAASTPIRGARNDIFPTKAHLSAPFATKSATPACRKVIVNTAPVSASQHKRRHSALDDISVSSGTSTPSSGSAKRRQIASGPAALNSLTEHLAAFTDAFRSSAEMDTAPPPIAPSPQRKMLAIERAQDLEDDLDDDSMILLINLFQKESSSADAYLVLKRAGLRKAWVRSKVDLAKRII